MTNHAPLHPRTLIACAAVSIALAAPVAARPRDALYQWTDATGAVRYTTQIERIPITQRGAAVRVAGDPTPRAGEKPAAERPPSAAQPSIPPSPEVAALDARIAELEKSIAADEAALADYISDPDRAKRPPESGDIAAIADRLPRLQNELRELRAQRAAAAGAPAAPNAP